MVRVVDKITDLPESWITLLSAAGEENFFSGYDWFENLAASTEREASPRIYGVESAEGEPVLVMVMQAPAATAGSVLRRMKKKDADLSAFTNYCSCLYGPAIAPGIDLAGPIRELVRFLKQEQPGWRTIEFNSLDGDAPFLDSLIKGLRKAGFMVGSKVHYGNWFDRFSGINYSEYLSQRSGKVRKEFKNYARKRRKLEREGEVAFEIFCDESKIDHAIACFDEVTALSWKSSDQNLQLTHGILRIAARTGRLRMGVLYFQNAPIAMEVAVLSGPYATMINTAYAQEYRNYSVGSLCMIQVVEHLIEVDGVDEIDLGRDDQDYKQLWFPKRRERRAIVAFSPWQINSWPAMAAFFGRLFVDKAAELARPLVKPVRQKLVAKRNQQRK